MQKSIAALLAFLSCTDRSISIQHRSSDQVATAVIGMAVAGCLLWRAPAGLFKQGISVGPPGETEETGDNRAGWQQNPPPPKVCLVFLYV